MKIIVLGGTGFIGSYVCEHLIRAGHRVTLPTRRLDRAKELQMLPGLEVVQCDVNNPAQLTAIARHHDALINLIAILHGSTTQFMQAHVKLPQAIVAACQVANIGRIVHISSIGANVQAQSHYLSSKAKGEEIFLASGLDVRIARPSVVYGREDRFLNLFAKLQKILPVMPLAGANAQLQPVWVQDVAQGICRLLLESSSSSVVEMTGDTIYTLRDLVRMAGEFSGTYRPIFSLPHSIGWMQALAMEHLPGSTLMSRDNLYSLRTPNIASGCLPGLRELGIVPASVEAIAPTFLNHDNYLNVLRSKSMNPNAVKR